MTSHQIVPSLKILISLKGFIVGILPLINVLERNFASREDGLELSISDVGGSKNVTDGV
jgi:hypothetical protein